MAKKTFNIKSTLAVQPKQLSVDDIESAIKQIHEGKKAPKPETKAKPAKEAPSIKERKVAEPKPAAMSPRKRSGRAVTAEEPVRKVRLSVDIHPTLHKRLKIKAIEHDSDIMHYVEMLIERDLG